jgi:hypothetical protein
MGRVGKEFRRQKPGVQEFRSSGVQEFRSSDHNICVHSDGGLCKSKSPKISPAKALVRFSRLRLICRLIGIEG